MPTASDGSSGSAVDHDALERGNNASAPVEAAASVWRGPKRVFSAPPDRLVPPASNAKRFAAAGGLRLGPSLPPGQYVLQVAARVPGSRHHGLAVQRVDFEVR